MLKIENVLRLSVNILFQRRNQPLTSADRKRTEGGQAGKSLTLKFGDALVSRLPTGHP